LIINVVNNSKRSLLIEKNAPDLDTTHVTTGETCGRDSSHPLIPARE
jgi:hypothetical protein